MKKSILFLATMIMITACCKKIENPFFVEWETPHGLPPFEQIEEKHFLPAIEEGIKQQQAEVSAIINSLEAPTFENTIEAYDHSGALLSKVIGVLFNLSESDSNDSINAIVEKALPLLSEHNDNIFMNTNFYKRVAAVYNKKEQLNLTIEQSMLLEKMNRSFVRNGIALDTEKQTRLREINKQISALEQKFGNNLLAENNGFQLILNEEDLTGLPEAVRTSAAEAATTAGYEGKWLFGLQSPSRIPFLQYSCRRDLREKMYTAYVNRGNNGNDNDNNQIVLDIMKLRIEKANILGFDTPSNFILNETMAKNSTTVNEFLAKIFESAITKAKEERAELQKLIDNENGGFQLQAWDWDFYTEKLRQEKYALNEDEIKPYFQMENVRAGVFAVANKLFGLKFEKLEKMPIYHSDVEVFKITDSNDSLIGLFYTDYYPRASKRGGAWMSNFRDQRIVNGKQIRPIVVNVGNFTKPTSETPSLLTLDEVETMFHEFGHALHGLLSQCNYVSLSGTNVARDFVELPSQILENWAFEPEVLQLYAKHYKTGEVIPNELVEKIQNAINFNQGFMTTELVAASILDMNWHDLKSVEGVDVQQFEKQKMTELGLIPEIAPRYCTTNFNHIFNSGYSAGYYSYLWAEVLDKDAFDLFKEKGIFDAQTAKSFRQNILEKGGSDEPMKLYKQFRGAEPNPEAMLKGRGLK
ncbi:MAG: M3 family metallopeptidase [Paludibacteraceae bacterium]|nr:M3 family metallopeptidase [Paludibacteraceae bacterium]